MMGTGTSAGMKLPLAQPLRPNSWTCPPHQLCRVGQRLRVQGSMMQISLQPDAAVRASQVFSMSLRPSQLYQRHQATAFRRLSPVETRKGQT
mmetsp:Transcript_58136/g.189408  ORF Transcript_58136/g.189408 Transcript_58136/m.189408 type:complete len:92 (-) Transcript_58136:1297-1572(-)